jgi:hypothetical protein
MGKPPNYGFAKRQKEMKRQKKQEAKRLRRLNKPDASDAAPGQNPAPDQTPQS